MVLLAIKSLLLFCFLYRSPIRLLGRKLNDISMRVFVPAHRSDSEHGEPEIALRVFRGDLIEQVAFPGDVVVDVHETDDNVNDPYHKEDNPVRVA